MSIRLSVVVPIHNEEESLPALFLAIQEALSGIGEREREYEVICVDDGSRDKSFQVLKDHAARDSRIRVVRFMRNFGQTAALSAGFDRAKGDVVVPLDADLQNDPKDIPKMLAELDKGYDVISGWRRHRQDAYLSRILPSQMANWLISKITEVPLHDYGCTLKAYRRELLQTVRLYGEMHRFIPAYAVWNGARLKEMEVQHHPRRFGKSKYGIVRTFKVVLDLMFVKFWTRYLARPMHFFGGLGLFFCAVGVGAGVFALALKLIRSVSFISTPLPLLTVFLILLGIQFLLLGVIAEILTRTYHESQGKPTYLVRETVNLA